MKKTFWIQEKGLQPAYTTESFCGAHDIGNFIEQLQEKFDIVGIAFEKHRIRFYLRDRSPRHFMHAAGAVDIQWPDPENKKEG